MVIKASSAAEVRGLIDALLGPDAVAREAAAARLTVIGSRAVDHLAAAYATTTTERHRLDILRVLESIADSRSMEPARAALAQGPGVALAGLHVMRALLDAQDAHARNEALDILMATALDASAPPELRQAAFEALRDLPSDVRSRVAEALGSAATPAGAPPPAASSGDEGIWSNALDGRLPDRPDDLTGPLAAFAPAAPLTTLHALVDALRRREKTAGDEEGGWLALRGAVHNAHAQRGSRVALYDLRETLAEAAGPLPVSFLAAVRVLGDSTCVEPLAAAYVNASPDEAWWRQQLASACQAVMLREKLTRRSAVVKRAVTRFPGAALLFSSPRGSAAAQ
jgi:hypothetical protein